jgi:hypothetical protein
MSVGCNGLWTEFIGASVVMDDIWRVFLGAFAKLRKATITFVISVRPSAWNDSAPNGRIVMEFDIWVHFEKLSGIQVSLKS